VPVAALVRSDVGIQYSQPKAKPLPGTVHPERAVYLVRAENHGSSREALDRCHHFIMFPGGQLDQSLIVSVAGNIIM
jgi:tRNA G18 (ribose-2'-O)-methylase SpoU